MAQFDVFSLAAAVTALLLATGLLIAYAINRSMTSLGWWAGCFLLLAISIATSTMRLDPTAMWLRWVSPTSSYAAACVVTFGLYRQGAIRNPLIRVINCGLLLLAVVTTLTLLRAPPPHWFLLGPVPTLVFMIWSAILVFRAGALGYGLTLLGGIVAVVVPPLSHPGDLQKLGWPLRPAPPTLRGAVGPGPDPAAVIPLDGSPSLRGLLDFAPPPGPQPPIEHPLMIAMIIIAALVALAAALLLRDLLARFDSMRERSTTDAMTGLLNRVTFEEAATALLAERGTRPVCVILFDIDHFKRINDTAGHAAGDRVIIRLGRLLRESTVLHYVAGRMGGEEFAVIVANSELGTARLFAEAIRAGFSASDFSDDIDWRVTLSAGVAMRQPGESLDSLNGRADKALYAAKANGRDRVVLAPASGDSTPRRGRSLSRSERIDPSRQA